MDLTFTLQSDVMIAMMIVSRGCQGPMLHVESSQHFSLWRNQLDHSTPVNTHVHVRVCKVLYSITYATKCNHATWRSVKHVYCNVTIVNGHEAAPSTAPQLEFNMRWEF